ncbi:MAG: tetraacyldisaccharide 4'-kinase [Xanthomonadales bacterium]|nr:tetraacyldisaccharide 4'-kinase [Xanthomonadales bacterium]MCB1634103.1 tetraacyldisaccharide 4'-kinase [Xanthomonadales bacterium]
MWRAALERRLNAIWYEGARPWPGLALLSRLYGWLRQRRLRRAERSPAQSLAVPVIVVGNLTAGGSGKTPLVAAVVDHLRQQGRHPGVISRGYGRRGDALRRVQPDSSAIEVGDEPLLLQRRCGVPVAVAADRRLAAQALIDDDSAQVDVLVADDGLEHLGLPRQCEIVVIDARRGFGNGRLLPAGPLRAPPERAAQAQLRVSNGGDWPQAHRMELRPSGLFRLQDGTPLPLSWLAGRDVSAAAGIAHPQRFFDTLTGLGARLMRCEALPDHVDPAELREAVQDRSTPWLITEKDAMKLHSPWPAAEVVVLTVTAELPEAFWQMLWDCLDTAAGSAAS